MAVGKQGTVIASGDVHRSVSGAAPCDRVTSLTSAMICRQFCLITERDMDPLVAKHRDAIKAIAAENGLCNVRLFGSRARGDHRPDSDLDLLVDRQPPRGHLLNLCNMTGRVEALTGLRVDVATEGMLYDSVRDRILEEAVLL